MDRPTTRVHHRVQVPRLGNQFYTPREKVPCVKPTRGRDADIPLLVNVPDIKTDLIHVAQQRHTRRPTPLVLGHLGTLAAGRTRRTPADQRPHRVGAHLVKEAHNLLLDQRPHAFLTPGYAWCLAQTLE